MNDKISKNSLEILDRVNNLISSESIILTELLDKKKEYVDLKSEKEECILNNTNKLNETNKEIEDLKAQSESLKDIFVANPTDNFKLLIDVLELNFNPDKDIEIICDKLPLQLSIRTDMIDELSKVIDEDNSTVMDCNENIKDLKAKLVVALNAQAKLIELLDLAKKGTLNKTRDDVVSVLTGVNFNDEEAKTAAKIILFPEDELVPYFEKTDFDKLMEANKELLADNMDNNDSGEVDGAEVYDLDTETETLEETEEVVEEKNEAETIDVNQNDDDFKIFGAEEETTNLFKEESTPISLDEIDNKKEEVEETTEVVDDVKEPEPEVSIFGDIVEETVPVDDSFDLKKELVNLGRNEVDVNLAIKNDVNLTKEEFNSAINTLKDLRLDVNNIPLLAFNYGITNYIKNIEAIYDSGYQIDNMELEKFSASLYLTKNSLVNNNLKVLNNYNVSLIKNNGKLSLKTLSINTAELISKLDLLITLGEYENVINNTELLCNDVAGICERILFCDVNNIPYTENKGGKIYYRDFVYDQMLLESLVEKNLELNNIVSEKENNDSLRNVVESSYVDVLDNFYSDLDVNVKVKNTDKFNELLSKINNVMSFSGQYFVYNGYVFSYNSVVRNMTLLLNQNMDIKDSDVILVSLLYNSHYTLEDMQSIKDAFNM